MNSKPIAFLVLLATLTTTLSAWADVTIPGDDCPTTLTQDVTIESCGELTVNETIDLAGYKLYCKSVTGLAGSGTITDTTKDATKPGELHLIVTSDFSASAVGLTGNLRLVKDGEKTLTMAYSSTTYTGGNVISNGTLLIGTTSKTLANFKPLGAKGNSIIVYPDGVLDVNGKYNFNGVYSIDLYGGKIYTSTTCSTQDFNPILTLYADSEYHLGANKTLTLAGKIYLNDHTLKINLDSGTTCKCYPTSVENGTLLYTGKGKLDITKALNIKTVSFTEEGTELSLGDYALSVSNYVSNLTSTRTKTTGTLQVYGAFIPNTDNFYPPTMMNGSTICLANKTDVWSAESGVIEAIRFDEGAQVSLDMGERAIEDNQQLIAWDKDDVTGLDFKLVGANATGFSVSVKTNGLWAVDTNTQVTDATWTGLGSDGDVHNTNNWNCTTAGGKTKPGVLPDGNINVKIPYTALVDINCTPDAPLVYKTLTFTGEKPTDAQLPADRDWRGLGALDFEFPLNLNGHDLTIALVNGTSANEVLVTNSAETVTNVLHVVVDAENSYDNQTVSIGGNITLVKEGAGTFVATKCPQEYAGLTIVNNGILKCADKANLNANGAKTEADAKSPFGAQRMIDIAPAGILDPAASYAWKYQTINLDGGAISNTVAEKGVGTSAYNVGADNYPYPFNPTINVRKPSMFATEVEFNFNGSVYAGVNK